MRFGTDGIRGPYGTPPITPEEVMRLGRAIARWAGGGPIVVGRDTRKSSPMLAQAMTLGLCETGAVVLDAGIMPTAAVSCAVVSQQAKAGVMITASHNAWQDNGVKVMGPDGRKATDPEAIVAKLDDGGDGGTGAMINLPQPLSPWTTALPKPNLRNTTLLIDCANGAAAHVAPGFLESLGATVIRRACAPNGQNINDGCGALHPPTDLQGADLAICLDGDGDRVTLVHPTLGILDGDDLLFWLAKERGVGTVMTNGGLDGHLEVVRTPVGDHHVAQAMAQHHIDVGAEPSGHVMFTDGLPTSDGLYTALRLLSVGIPSTRGWKRLPQANRNIPGQSIPEVVTAVAEAESDGHRVVLRPSGTEPVIRIMVEGPNAKTWLNRIASELS